MSSQVLLPPPLGSPLSKFDVSHSPLLTTSVFSLLTPHLFVKSICFPVGAVLPQLGPPCPFSLPLHQLQAFHLETICVPFPTAAKAGRYRKTFFSDVYILPISRVFIFNLHPFMLYLYFSPASFPVLINFCSFLNPASFHILLCMPHLKSSLTPIV